MIIAGEKSGEDHAMTFLPKIIEKNQGIQFFGVGGKELEKQGVELIYHLKEFSGIGFTEVLSKIPFYYRAFDRLLSEVEKRNCKTAILIDFQTFNLKLAKKLSNKGVHVLYYVAPQAWVWKPWRATVLEKCVHTLFTILPFEKKWFEDRGVTKVKSVIHPLMIEHGSKLESYEKKVSTRRKILLLPGSRNNEIKTLFETFRETQFKIKEKHTSIEFGVVTSDSVQSENYGDLSGIDHKWSSEDLASALEWADIAIAASGTVTLTTGLFQVPTVVCYKVSFISELIIKFLVPYKGPISLTNIIHDEYVFPELTQKDVNPDNIFSIVDQWIEDDKIYSELIHKLSKTRKLLTGEDIDVPQLMVDVIND